MCPPLTKRKAGRPKQSIFKAWFEKGGSSKKGKKDDKPKRPQKGNKNICKLCQELRHQTGSSKCRYTPEKPKKYSIFFCYCYCFFFTLFCCKMTCYVFQ